MQATPTVTPHFDSLVMFSWWYPWLFLFTFSAILTNLYGFFVDCLLGLAKYFADSNMWSRCLCCCCCCCWRFHYICCRYHLWFVQILRFTRVRVDFYICSGSCQWENNSIQFTYLFVQFVFQWSLLSFAGSNQWTKSLFDIVNIEQSLLH